MVGIGVLGAGNIAEKNIRALGLSEGGEVVALGSRDVGKARAQLERLGLGGGTATAYGSYEAVIADPRVDALYITLPAAFHLPWVRAAAAAGKSVLLEKPVAVDGGELDAMLAATAAAGVQLMDGTMWAHNPRTERMAAVLHDAAAVGAIKDVTATFCFFGSEEFHSTNVRTQKSADPLGALGDLGWYCVRAILWAYDFEAPTAVVAHAGAEFTDDGVPLHIGATLLFPGGRRGHFQCGFDGALTQCLEVRGTLGTVRADDFVIPFAEKQSSFLVTSNHGLRDSDTWDATQRDVVTVNLDKQQEVLMWERFAGLVAGLKAGGQPDPFWPRIAEQTQRVLFAVEQSAREGCRQVAFTP